VQFTSDFMEMPPSTHPNELAGVMVCFSFIGY